MKTKIVGLVLLFLSLPSLAGSVAGFGGATEITQIINMTQLVAAYAQQVQQYENQLMQYSTMVQNLEKNPMGVTGPDLQKAAQDQARLLSVGKDIASSMSRVDTNFSQMFGNSQAGTAALSFANKFANWSAGSTDALKAAMLNAGLQRQNFQSDGQAIQSLVSSVSASNGALGALQSLGSLNAAQIQESMKLRDLISQQQVAQNTYMASQTAKEQAKQDNANALIQPYTETIPMIGNEKLQIRNWSTSK